MLESTEGESFRGTVCHDKIIGEIHEGRTARGGVLFEIYDGSIPQILRFKTGRTVNNISMEAISPELQSVIPALRKPALKLEEAAAKPNIKFSDAAGLVSVEILQILTGDEILKQKKVYDTQQSGAREQGKQLIYFQVRVKNIKAGLRGAETLQVLPSGFMLESTEGESFSGTVCHDKIIGEIHEGRTARGGVLFEIYDGSIPQILRFKTGRTVNNISMEAISPELQSVIPALIR